MLKRRTLLCGLALVIVLLAAVGSWLLIVPNTVTRDSFDKIEGRFTLEQVERLIGRHADAITVVPASEDRAQQDRYWWQTHNASLGVYFENGRMVGKSMAEYPSLFDHLRAWLGL